MADISFALSGNVPLNDVTIYLHDADNVVIARTNLQAGTRLIAGSNQIVLRQTIPAGHKMAIRRIPAREVVRRYGQVIGFATQAIAPGEHVHTHNLAVQDFQREYAFGKDVRPMMVVPEHDRLTFLGYQRGDGRVGTRNLLAVISTVNCSAHVCRAIAHHFTRERLAAYPNVDGVIALTHPYGCATQIGGADHQQLQRVLAGMAHHANVGAYLLVGLGCEANQMGELLPVIARRAAATPSGPPTFHRKVGHGQQSPMHAHETAAQTALSVTQPSLSIQELGGTRKTIEAGIEAVEQLLPQVNVIQRTPQPISELTIALQCGGSDGWSGVTANPLVGRIADEIVQQGGSVVLAETPEIYGAEHLLTRRAISREVGKQLIDKVRWWEDHTRRMGTEIDNNPSPGNKAGGLTTIYEKALGAIAKSGSTPLTGVYDYAEPITTRGFAFMDSPGYDPVSVTGQVASGCNLVLFTTGRGSTFGFKPAPSIKVATNSSLFNRMMDDMDFDAGRMLDGESMDDVANELFELVIAVASGQPSKSEAQDIGEAEFAPWHLGETL
jgi:altronate hydrolase